MNCYLISYILTIAGLLGLAIFHPILQFRIAIALLMLANMFFFYRG